MTRQAVRSLHQLLFPSYQSRSTELAARLSAGLVLWLVLGQFADFNPLQAQAQELELGKPVQRELTAGGTQSFQVSLTAGQFLHVVVEQRGIDVVLRLWAPDGQKLVEMDSPNSTQGPEAAALIAEQTGTYRIEAASLNQAVPAGQLVMQLQALRPATEQDRRWIAAQRAFLEGNALQRQSTGTARQQAIEKFQEARLAWGIAGDQVMEAHALLRLGQTWGRLGQPQRALSYVTQALELQRGGAAQREEANTLVLLGNIHNELWEPKRALEYFGQALMRQRALADTYAEAQTLLNQGAAYYSLGETARALETYTASLSFWQKVKHRPREATTLHNIGLVYAAQGEFQQALEYYLRALTLQRVLQNPEAEADELNSLGSINGQLGEWQQALTYFEQALARWRVGGNPANEAVALKNIGAAYFALQQFPPALEHYTRALKLNQEVRNRRGEAQTLEKIGELHAAQAQPLKALEAFDQALPLRRALEDRRGEASTLAQLGNDYLTLGVAQKALDNFTPALPLYRAVGDRRGEASVLYGLARVAFLQEMLAEARQYIEAALTIAEAVRADAGSQQARTSYFGTVQQYYQLDVDVLMQLHRVQPTAGFAAQAWQTSERARARSLLEELADARADIRQGADPALLARERELQQLLNTKAQRQLQLQEQRSAETSVKGLQQDLSTLEDEYRQLQFKLRQSSPRYTALTQPQPVGLTELQQQLDADTLLLEYALGPERSYLWAVTKTGLTAYELPAQAQIASAVQTLNRLLTARGIRVVGETPPQQRTRLAQADTQLNDAAHALSRLILSPVAAQLKQQPLVIIADGALQYVPFAMLPEPSRTEEKERENAGAQSAIRNPQSAIPLIVNHELVTLPSASTLAELRKASAGRTPAPKMLAVLADPVFSRADAQSRLNTGKTVAAKPAPRARSIQHEEEKPAVALGRFQAPRLPFTRQEAERIYALAPAEQSLKALDYQASRATAMSAELSQYRYLHFATHGLVDSEHPGMSAIVLSLIDEKGQPQNGFLRAHELYNLNLPAELVVLSACQTALGKDYKGEGLVGLTRGFMYAGAPRVIVSLWNVNDKATAELMARFYERMLRDGQRPAAALRTAQVEMWRQKQWEAPYYWAAFMLQGEWK
ncbi:MAG: CHAT domain-containing protein [Acidobacteria bacterium]|nr:CHAT domain-containing protein [Acidobacteriota bacterium]